MLISDFYTVQKISAEDGAIDAEIRLNPKHEVYDGHFPDQPVVPGVIQLQIVKEILEDALKKELFMETISNAKYLKMIVPDKNVTIHFAIQYKISVENIFQLNAQISSGETLHTKLKARFIPK